MSGILGLNRVSRTNLIRHAQDSADAVTLANVTVFGSSTVNATANPGTTQAVTFIGYAPTVTSSTVATSAAPQAVIFTGQTPTVGAVAVTLDLNFAANTYAKNGSSYALSSVPGISLTTPAAYAFNSDNSLVSRSANTGRISNKGLLIEQATTNVVANPDDISNAEFGSYQVSITTGAITAPDGVGTAQKIAANTVNDFHSVYVNSGYAVAAGSTWTQSTFLKAAGLNYAHVQFADISDTNGLETIVNLATQAIASSGALGAGTMASVNALACANGWTRAILTGIIDSSTTSSYIEVDCSSATSAVFAGANTTDGIYTWHQQYENLPFATSPCYGTRAADDVHLAYSPPSSNFQVDVNFATSRAIGQTRTLLDWHDGTDNNKILLTMNASNQLVLTIIRSGTPTVIATEGGTPAASRSGTASIVCSGAGGSVWSLQLNGSTIATASATKPTVTTMQFGQNRALTSAMNDNVAEVKVTDLSAVVAGTDATATAGTPQALHYTGYAPTIAYTMVVTAGAPQAIAITGQAPTLSAGDLASPGVGSVAYSGKVPTNSASAALTAGTTQALTFTGFAPTVTAGDVASPGVGSIAFSGKAPLVIVDYVATPGTSNLTFTGLAPSTGIGVNAAPGTGALVFAGFPPTVVVGTGVIAQAGPTQAVVLTGYVPSNSADQALTAAATQAISISPKAPTTSASAAAQPGTQAIVFTGYAPTTSSAQLLFANAGPTQAVAFAGKAPTIAASAIAASGINQALGFTALAPTTNASTVASPGAASLTFTGYAPSANIMVEAVCGPPQAITLTGNAPTVRVNYAAAPGTGALVFTGYPPFGQSLTANIGSPQPLIFTGHAPTVVVSNPVVAAATQAVHFTGYPPTKRADAIANCGTTQALHLTGGPALTIATTQPATPLIARPRKASILFRGYAPDAEVIGGIQSVIITGYPPRAIATSGNSPANLYYRKSLFDRQVFRE